MKRILVIGSNSFSGSTFVAEAVRQGYEVWGVSRSEEPMQLFLPYKWSGTGGSAWTTDRQSGIRFFQADINKNLDVIVDIIDKFKPGFVVNFAGQGMVAESWENPTHWYKTNLISQVALHEELRHRTFIKKYIHFTTPEVYGSTGGRWVDENTPFNPTTPYAVSRAACDMHLDSYFRAYGFPVVFTRAANVYGPGQQLYRIVPKTFLSAMTGRRMVLHGGGLSRRSFIHILDVCKALVILCEEGEPGSSWHLSTKKDISIVELVQRISKLCKVDVDQFCSVGDERLGKDKDYFLDSSRMRQEHDWSDNVRLEDGLDEVKAWIDSNIESMLSLPWEYGHKE